MKRQEAKDQGLHIYSSNKPCKYGHAPLRYTSNGGCIACYERYHKIYPQIYNREKNTIRQRGYRDRHREKLREYLREYMRTYRKRPESLEYDRQRQRQNYAKQKGDPEFRARRLAANRAYHEKHKDDPDYKRKNRERAKRAYQKRKAQKKAAA